MQDKICLLIDDDVDDHEIFIEALQDVKIHYQCVTAINGQEAITLLTKSGLVPDYIFLDLNMPIMSGKICLAEIKKITALQDIPVIIYTTSSYSNDIEETQRLGATHFLVKPSSIATLTRILNDLFTQKQPSFLIKEAL